MLRLGTNAIAADIGDSVAVTVFFGGCNGADEIGEETESWRRCIVCWLRGIEMARGWPSNHRVRSLLEWWELPGDWGMESDAVS